jgi:copper homeostasis protein
MPHPVLVEAAVDSPESAARAVAEGAGRLELCHDLSVGGLTPHATLLDECGSRWGVPVAVMIRPRAGNFVYSAYELSAMIRAIAHARDAGAGSVVLGVLRANHTIDELALRRLIEAAQDTPVAFHRAFDCTRNLDSALDTLADFGVARVLTGGGQGAARDHHPALAHLMSNAGTRIEILAGGSVRGDHVADLVLATGVHAVHARGTEPHTIADIVAALRPHTPPS